MSEDRYKTEAEKKRYFEWRRKVLRRDQHRCVLCKATEKLEVHHIVPWSRSVKFRFVVANGVTLCRRHHKLIHRRNK